MLEILGLSSAFLLLELLFFSLLQFSTSFAVVI